MKMKRMIYLMLLFMVLGAASAKAQVVIGGGDDPLHASAVLELRSSNKGLLLPQVALGSITDDSTLAAAPKDGLLVCNATETPGALAKGVYYWSVNQWVLYIKF
jgi:hypothetical protein